MSTLLVGGSGFVGKHLQNYLQHTVSIDVQDKTVDLRNSEQTQSVIAKIKPDYVIHLAAITSIQESFKDPYETFNINFLGTLNLLKALEAIGFNGRMLYVSSGEVYGPIKQDDLPAREDMLLKPTSPYDVSKIAAEALCYQWSQTNNFDIIIVRPFNHIGPGQSIRFAIPDFAKQVIEIELGLREPILSVGDVNVSRDFTDVRDVVTAYDLLLKHGKNGAIYNVCSGKEYNISSIIQDMLEIVGIKVEIRQEDTRLRPIEKRRIFGSYNKIFKDTGWQPKISMKHTLTDILEEWRKLIRE